MKIFFALLAFFAVSFCFGCGEDGVEDPIVEDPVDPIGPVAVSLSRTTRCADPGMATIGDTVTLALESEKEIAVRKRLVQFTVAGEDYGTPVDIALESGSTFRYTASFVVDANTPTGPVGFSFARETVMLPGDSGSVLIASPAEVVKIVMDRMRPQVDAIIEEVVKLGELYFCWGVLTSSEFSLKSRELFDSLDMLFEEEPIMSVLTDRPVSIIDTGLSLYFIHNEHNRSEIYIDFPLFPILWCPVPFRWRPFELFAPFLEIACAHPGMSYGDVIPLFASLAERGQTTLLRPGEIEGGLTALDVMFIQENKLKNSEEKHMQTLEEWEAEQEDEDEEEE